MRRSLLVLTVLAVALPLNLGAGDEPKKKGSANGGNKVRELMRRKLDYSQKVLAGIALDDYNQISKNATELLVLSNKLEWNVLKTPQYDLHSNEFRRSLEGLIKNAEKKNLDAAALAYVDMTLTCVRCHKYVREVRMTRLEGNGPRPQSVD